MNKKKGFTLIELMVAMGIIAVLVTMSVVAIQIVQRSLRDTQRRDVLNTVNLWLAGYYNDNGRYPGTAQINFNGANGVTFTGTTPATDIVELSGATSNAVDSDSDGTDYCYYSATGASYRLGLKLESGSEVQLGNEGTDCATWDTL
ncbi:type II secretion system protein [Candidatus Dojkabacteria bacterium]|uniref:Type II secretion system protein n=1 Tax=Candidatus Dojkabacteria bacterium TaxID=2099670 RepID=A0A955L9P4_9BACT|nr:type II secretion system protein [Candidatus Dojkabacteria bacterium]